MNHQDGASRNGRGTVSVRRNSAARLLTAFEEHLFECSECAMDVKTGRRTFPLMLPRAELIAPRRVTAPYIESPRRLDFLVDKVRGVLASGVGRQCLLVLAFQNIGSVSASHENLEGRAEEQQAPAVLTPLVLANGRRPWAISIPGRSLRPSMGFFVLSQSTIPATG